MAFTKQEIDLVLKNVQHYSHVLDHNRVLFDIYEGDLLTYLLADLSKQLSPQSFEVVKHRVAPINVLKRIVDKLSTIYAKPPKRSIKDGTGTKQDEELLSWYEENMSINALMNISNELFNLHKNTTIEPYIDQGMPKIRAIPADRFLMVSTDEVDPTRPTIFVKFMGKREINGESVEVLYLYSAESFAAVTIKGTLLPDVLLSMDNPDGINPVGDIPAVYVNRSFHQLVPQIDTDILKMTKIIPTLISDLNYAIMFQSFSIVYGVDVDSQNLLMSPNAFWNFKSDPTSDKTPSVGVLKPSVDIQQVMQFIQSELSFWLNTKNIRPGAIGSMNADQTSSGISKIIDEMDTSEDRQKQVHYYKKAEAQLWELITKKLHPYWTEQKLINTNLKFSPNVEILVEFQEQVPLSTRSEILKDAVIELDKSLTSKQRAIKAINPDMTEEDIKALIEEIKEERTTTIEIPEDNNDNQMPNQEPDNKKEMANGVIN